jgi:hypothetical protein
MQFVLNCFRSLQTDSFLYLLIEPVDGRSGFFGGKTKTADFQLKISRKKRPANFYASLFSWE